MADGSPESSSPVPPHRQDLRTRWGLWGALLGIAILSLVYLFVAPSPWSEGLDTSREVKESIRTRSWTIIGLWTGAAINLVLISLALLAWNFRPNMVDPSPGETPDPSSPPDSSLARWGRRGLVLAAMLVVGWNMYPRLSLDLWGDEDATTRRFLIGHVYRMDDDSFIIKEPSWLKTAWNYDTGTNSHMLFNIVGRLSHGSADTSGSDPSEFYFDPVRIRLPSFLATLGLIPVAAWLVALLGFPRGGPVTAFLLAFHPWIVRFGSDARGYALLLLFGGLAIAFLVRAFQDRHRARWWLGFGICQFLALSANLGAVYLLFPLNLTGLMIAWSPLCPGHANPFRVANTWRMAGASLLGALLTLQWMMPLALQMPAYLEGGRLEGEVSRGFLPDWAAFWLLGSPWFEWNAGNPFSLTAPEIFRDHPVATSLSVALVALGFLAGLAALLRRKSIRWWLLPLAAPAPLLILDAIRSGHLLYPWYTVSFLPQALVVVGAGFGAIAALAGRRPGFSGRLVPAVIAILLVGAFAVASRGQRTLYREHPVEPTGDAVRLTREVVNPFHPRIDESLTLGFVHASRLYDPAMTLADNDVEFIAGLRDAEARGLPLSVNAANLGLGPIYFPIATEMINDREVFEAPQVIHGLQAPCTRYVFKYRPGGLARFEERHGPLPERPPEN